MIDRSWQKVDGIIQPGHQIASGSALESPYPRGSIEMQTPFFKALGLDITPFFQGTLNVSIEPKTFEIVEPEFTFQQVKWIENNPPEDFSFSRCRVLFEGAKYDGLIYYPHPETKIRHFHNPSIIEILAPLIPEIRYGSRVEIEYNPLEIRINLND
ncbi:hypothetical protein [Roseofilum capinflatum]|uniref:Riboflavin kinase n=1 Tax=Roseofilum capinflatum BLCC-M114 TaxID=3022440 RepID=A0ABT7B505_9CYAN|nr:hypothetical protein [Roseofilum capinflatum]MDJ1173333.1 hypothetical protein [Roseofilum capinflatum BLCC-M114]